MNLCSHRSQLSIQTVKPDAFDESLHPIKPASIEPAKPESQSLVEYTHGSQKLSATSSAKLVETCAQCGGPINDKSRIFCKVCGVCIREEPSGDTLSIVKYPILDPAIKFSSAIQNPQVKRTNEQSVFHREETHILQNFKKNWGLIAIIYGIIVFFLIYVLILLLIYFSEAKLSFPVPV